MTEATSIATIFEDFAIDHTPDGWPAVKQMYLNAAAAELRRLEAQLQTERTARQAAQIENEALKERLVRADAEKCAAVLAAQQPAAVQGPYAWVVIGTGLFSIGPERPFDDDVWQPLYTAPQPAKQEPVAWRFRKNGHWAFRNDNVQGLVCEPLFATPVTESVYKSALDEWLDKTEWVQKTVKTHELGMHLADVLRQRIEASQERAMNPPEPYLYYADSETFTVEAVADLFADDSGMEKLYSESQLKAEIERRDAVLRQALGALEVHCSFAKRDGPCAMEDGITAINAIQDILK